MCCSMAQRLWSHETHNCCFMIEQVLCFAVQTTLALQDEISLALFLSALLHQPQCTLAFAGLELDASTARMFQLSVLRHISDNSADISDATMLRAALLVQYLTRNPATDFLTLQAAHHISRACLDALRLIWHAVDLSKSAVNKDLDDICTPNLELVISLLSHLGSWGFWATSEEPIIIAAAEVLCAAATAEKLLRGANLYSVLLTSMARIAQLCCNDSVWSELRDAAKKVELSRP